MAFHLVIFYICSLLICFVCVWCCFDVQVVCVVLVVWFVFPKPYQIHRIAKHGRLIGLCRMMVDVIESKESVACGVETTTMLAAIKKGVHKDATYCGLKSVEEKIATKNVVTKPPKVPVHFRHVPIGAKWPAGSFKDMSGDLEPRSITLGDAFLRFGI